MALGPQQPAADTCWLQPVIVQMLVRQGYSILVNSLSCNLVPMAPACRYGADLDAVSPKGWTALSYAKAKGKYGPTEEKGIYPEVRHTKADSSDSTTCSCLSMQYSLEHKCWCLFSSCWKPCQHCGLPLSCYCAVASRRKVPAGAGCHVSMQPRSMAGYDAGVCSCMQYEHASCNTQPNRCLCFCSCCCVQDVLLYHGASKYGSGPTALGTRSPRNSYDPTADNFSRERGSYQQMFEQP